MNETEKDYLFITSVKLQRIGASIASHGGVFRAAACEGTYPRDYILEELQEDINDAQRVLDYYLQRRAEASVEIVPSTPQGLTVPTDIPTDEHAAEVGAGIADFNAYCEAKALSKAVV